MVERTRQVDVKVGAFVLLALAILAAGSLWIAGSSLVGVRRVSYTVLLRNSGGVQSGDRVRFAGVSVGRVQRVHLAPDDPDWPVRLEITLNRNIAVRADSTARIATAGLLGSSVLMIEPGSVDEPLLPPGGEIQGTPTAALEETLAHVDEIGELAIVLIKQLSGLVAQVSDEIGPILENAEKLLSDENTENVTATLASLRETADEVSPRVVSLLARLEEMSVSLEGDMESFPELTEQATELLDRLQQAVGPDGVRLAAMLDAAENSLNAADETLSALGGSRQEIEWAIRDLRDTLANLRAFSQQVKERPFSLVRIKMEPDRRPGQGVSRDVP